MSYNIYTPSFFFYTSNHIKLHGIKTFMVLYTYFLALSFKKLCNSSSFWLPISRRRVVNLFCHSLQWLKRANFNGELSRSTKSILSTVSSFWKLLAISVYLVSLKKLINCSCSKGICQATHGCYGCRIRLNNKKMVKSVENEGNMEHG